MAEWSIARVEITYEGRQKLLLAAQTSEGLAVLLDVWGGTAPAEEHRHLAYMWQSDNLLIDLETDGPRLIALGITFEVKNFKGTRPLSAVLPTGCPVTVHVQIPHIGLLAMDEVSVEENCCTDMLQRRLDEGWRILCVCPPNAARRPDYILGRTRS